MCLPSFFQKMMGAYVYVMAKRMQLINLGIDIGYLFY